MQKIDIMSHFIGDAQIGSSENEKGATRFNHVSLGEAPLLQAWKHHTSLLSRPLQILFDPLALNQ